MKDDMLDVLLYLFQNYMGGEVEIEPDRDSMHTELVAAGFPSHEIGEAFEWLEDLAARQEAEPLALLQDERSFRIYSEQECEKLDTECLGYMIFLEQVGILNSETRELVLDRVMALATVEIDSQQLKWIVLMVLSNQPGQEEAYTWMEDMLWDDGTELLH